jgi:acyl carrier protein
MQTDDSILQKVYEILTPFVPEGQQIREETDLVADMGLDSLKVMKILENIEDTFDISIPLNILPDVRTVKDLVAQIQKIIEDE